LTDRQPITRPPRRDTVRVDVQSDVLYWTGLWGLTDRELREAVAAAGPIATDVAAYLGQPLEGEDLSSVFQHPK
jgi:hypothetical protein